MKKLVLSAVALSICFVQPALAQEVKSRGSEAISLGVTSDSGRIGYWHKVNDANSYGGDFSFAYSDSSHNDIQSYEFSPGIRHYLLPDKAISPYLYGALMGRYGVSHSSQPDWKSRMESYTVGVKGGIGLEWFPVQSVSIAGHVGVVAAYDKFHSVATLSTSSTTEDFFIGTTSSGLLLNLYF